MAPSNGVSALAWRDEEHCAALPLHYLFAPILLNRVR
jgi:hypothetical protein